MTERPDCPTCGEPMRLLETGQRRSNDQQTDVLELKFDCQTPGCAQGTVTVEIEGDPTHCPECGTGYDFDVTGDVRPDGVVPAEAYCPNPDCKTNESDLAPLAEGETGPRYLRQAEEGQRARD